MGRGGVTPFMSIFPVKSIPIPLVTSVTNISHPIIMLQSSLMAFIVHYLSEKTENVSMNSANAALGRILK